MSLPSYASLPQATEASQGLVELLQLLHDAPSGQEPAWAHAAVTPALREQLQQRRADLEQQILRDGVTHNVFSETGVAARPWSLALLPLVLPAAQWARIEAGVAQRAALLQALMDDLYGSQNTLRQGLLPGSLVLRHPGYLRPVRTLRPLRGLWLHLVAFDLARAADGQWCVVAQRCQAPSGLGYVLHNRILVSRQFPEAFRDLKVQHLAASYRALLSSLESAAREVAGGEQPRIAVLTPGPLSETYFEQAYLARYLGLPLVEGADLTVRQQRLYLKTVRGLEPVHGLLRRLDEGWCDPLELRADSQLGVPGLLQVLRAGQLVMANAPGSGVLESEALHGFLPALSRALLDQDLLLPSVDSWWCGEAAALEAVRDRWPSLVLRHTFPGTASAQRSLDEIGADPESCTARWPIALSQAPVWSEHGLTGYPCTLRVYAITDGEQGWRVLPGGMTRVAPDGSGLISMQEGGISLDTWVQTRDVVSTDTLLRSHLGPEDIRARHRPVASRVGEHLFWLGRYTERAEQCVMLARKALNLVDAAAATPSALQQALTQCLVAGGMMPLGAPSLAQSPRLFERALLKSLFDVSGVSGLTGLGYNLAAVHRCAQQLRERLSNDHWGLIRQALEVAQAQDFSQAVIHGVIWNTARGQVTAALDRLTLIQSAITGAQTDRMTRDHGWRLLTMGRLLERLVGNGQRLSAFLQAQAPESEAGVDALLELFDSTITFRARYQRQNDLLALADVLVLDDSNPRSLAGVLRRLRTEIGKLPGDAATWDQLLSHLPASGAGISLEDLAPEGQAADAQATGVLAAHARSLVQAGLGLSQLVADLYFTPAHALDHRI